MFFLCVTYRCQADIHPFLVWYIFSVTSVQTHTVMFHPPLVWYIFSVTSVQTHIVMFHPTVPCVVYLLSHQCTDRHSHVPSNPCVVHLLSHQHTQTDRVMFHPTLVWYIFSVTNTHRQTQSCSCDHISPHCSQLCLLSRGLLGCCLLLLDEGSFPRWHVLESCFVVFHLQS